MPPEPSESHLNGTDAGTGPAETGSGPSASDASAPTNVCELEGCTTPATQKCPTCAQLKLPDSYFCSQEHFKLAWKGHKGKHSVRPATYDPFPSHVYSGKLRAVYDVNWKPLKIPMRSVPDRIAKPDWYADGIPKSEERLGNSSKIEELKPSEIAKMRKVSRVCILFWGTF